MIDAILSYHLNPLTCGVAKFNAQLAERLGVPHASLDRAMEFTSPLASIKWSELTVELKRTLRLPLGAQILWHDGARQVLYADTLGIPATIHGNPTRGAYRVLTFGMAHKQLLSHYVALKAQLDAEHGEDYTVEMSTAIHEGHPWDEGLAQSESDMRAIFGDKLRVLGFLADDAIAKELQDCDAVAVYFDPAFRANNTTAWAAVAAGKTLFTNTDEHSPDISKPPTWDALIEALHA